jgi:hypothetical protein
MKDSSNAVEQGKQDAGQQGSPEQKKKGAQGGGWQLYFILFALAFGVLVLLGKVLGLF